MFKVQSTRKTFAIALLAALASGISSTGAMAQQVTQPQERTGVQQSNPQNQERFEKMKQKLAQRIQDRIENMQKRLACVQNAQNRDALRACLPERKEHK